MHQKRFDRNNSRHQRPLASAKFEEFCLNKGWQFDYTGLHQAHVNAAKLKTVDLYRPSYLVDVSFSDMEKRLIAVEVKSCNRDGEVRVRHDEIKTHTAISNSMYSVYYALYNPDNGAIRVIPLNGIQEIENTGEHIKFDFDTTIQGEELS